MHQRQPTSHQQQLINESGQLSAAERKVKQAQEGARDFSCRHRFCFWLLLLLLQLQVKEMSKKGDCILL
ncbi:hypothetical protein [Candidatus Cardinium hertigii]|uniref:hypothetical protein n=1 Tax=Candidatus Cardinium hertigii TaxID=247481 RepID=UPI00194FA8C5|nr:hypothetical protein [Candidatus Cardinium hertigii]